MKPLREPVPVYRIEEEHTPKEEQFREKKEPHADLLANVIDVLPMLMPCS
jgi:hypothetical protein